MLHFSEDAEINLLKSDEKVDLMPFLSEPRYRVGDIPITYRQIYLLSKDGLLDAQQDEGKWRKFSFVELVFLFTIKELKTIGFSNGQLVPLYEAFFKGGKSDMIKRENGVTVPRGYASRAIGYAFLQIPVTMRYTANGEVDFYDPVHLSLLGLNGRTCILINISDIVAQVTSIVGGKGEFGVSVFDALVKVLLSRTGISDKERQLLEILRDKQYETVTVRKKNDKLNIVNATRSGDGDMTDMELLKVIRGGDFRDITIHRRGGENAHFTVDDVIKL